MSTTPTILDSDFRYIDKKGTLLKSRTELSVAQMLSFLGLDYTYQHKISLPSGKSLFIDFITSDGKLIEVIDSEQEIEKYKAVKQESPDIKIVAVGSTKFAAKLKELDEVFFYDTRDAQSGSIFIEDPSFAFDYAHILPLVEKCSILHGHTSTVLVELVGDMKNNLLIDFGEAKKIIKETIGVLDHKFFINRKYLKTEDDSHFRITFEGPKGMFDMQVPKHTAYLLEGEATVENLSMEIIKILVPKLPKNIEAVGVYIYEGYNKGAHLISKISKA
jgi:6-pyruvoyltetrahydropterin/6-carboxytetrahydropterin synthase